MHEMHTEPCANMHETHTASLAYCNFYLSSCVQMCMGECFFFLHLLLRLFNFVLYFQFWHGMYMCKCKQSCQYQEGNWGAWLIEEDLFHYSESSFHGPVRTSTNTSLEANLTNFIRLLCNRLVSFYASLDPCKLW